MKTSRRLSVAMLLLVEFSYACGGTTAPTTEPGADHAPQLPLEPDDPTPDPGPNPTPGPPMFAVVRNDTSSTGGSGNSWWMVVLDSAAVPLDSVTGLPSQSPVAWSPDGARVAYGELGGLVILTLATKVSTRIPIAPARNAYRPAWSPDGLKIAFEAFTGNDTTWFDIFFVNVDGSDLTNLTNSFGGDWNASWSNDGTRIAFVSSRKQPAVCCAYPYPYMDIFTMNADGSSQARITDDDIYDDAPDWSPDGSRIVFSRLTADGGLHLHTVRPDGTELTPIGTTTRYDQRPKWSPDGKRIAYSARPPAPTGTNPAWDYEIYVIEPDGTGFRRVTNNKINDLFVSWKRGN